MGNDDVEASSWEQTPWWHPASWIGYRMRRWWWVASSIGGEYDGQWEYATYKQRALAHLKERFGQESDCAGSESSFTFS